MNVNPGLLPSISNYIAPRKRPPIREWAEDDRPREKLVNKGAATLSHAEILAILLNTGTPERSAVELAREILDSVDNNLSELARRDVHYLRQFRGIGEKKAITILAALEFARRRQSEPLLDKPVIRSSAEAAALLKPLLEDMAYEAFHVLYLNHANKLLHHNCVSYGGITSTTVDPRIVFEEALLHKSTRLILCHNHPSGNLRPSRSDISITRKMKDAGKLLEIEVLDHLIVSDEGYFSLREDGLMPDKPDEP